MSIDYILNKLNVINNTAYILISNYLFIILLLNLYTILWVDPCYPLYKTHE